MINRLILDVRHCLEPLLYDLHVLFLSFRSLPEILGDRVHIRFIGRFNQVLPTGAVGQFQR